MGYARLRQKYGYPPDWTDEQVVLTTRRRPEFAAQSNEDFAQGIDAYEAQGGAAAPGMAGRATPVAQPTAPSPALVQKYGGASAPFDFLRNAALEMGKDVVAYPQARLVDPAAQGLRGAASALRGGRFDTTPTPEEEERKRRALAVEVGLLSGGVGAPLEGLAARAGARPLLARILGHGAGGAAAGAADAGIRTGGDPRSMLAGGGVAALLGGGLGAIPRGRAPVAVAAREPSPPMMPIPEITPDMLREELQAALASRAADLPAPPPPRGFLDRLLTGESKPARVMQFLAPVNRRLQAFGEPGKNVERMMNRTLLETERNPGPTTLAYKKGGLGKLTPAEDAALQDALEGYKPAESLNPKLRALYDVAHAHRTETAAEAVRLGTKVRRGSEEVPFKPRENYMAHYIPKVDELAKPGELREAVISNMARNRGYGSREAAEDALDDYLLYKKSNQRQGGDIIAQHMVDQGKAKSIAEAKGILMNAGERPSRGRVNTLEMSRALDVDFYDPRPSKVLTRDLQEKERGLAEIRNLGQRTEKAMAEIEKIPDSRERGEAEALLKAALAAYDEGDPAGKGLLGAMRQINVLKFSPLTTVRNAQQGPLNSLLTSDIPSFVRGYGKSLTKAGRERSITSGAVGEGVIENVTESIGASPKTWISRWLDVIGFRPTERWLNRHPAGNVGVEMALKFARKLKNNPADKFAASELARLDLDPQSVLKNGLSETDLDMVALRHSQRGQFRNAPLDLPMEATRTQPGRTIAQFKTFDYQQARLIYDETFGRLASPLAADKRRGLRNIAIIATVFPLFGEAVNDIYAGVMHRERPKGLARYGENLGTAGATAIGGGLGTALAIGANDRGGAVAKYLAGPTVSSAAEGVQTATDVGTRAAQGKGGPTPSQKRAIARILGGGTGSIVGAQLFPSEKKKSKSKARKRKEER